MNNKFLPFLFVPIIMLFIGCDRNTSDPQGDEMARLNAWISVHGLESYKTPSGFYFIPEIEGTGVSPKDSDIVVYKYVVRNLDDFIYSNTYKDTAKLYDIYGLYSNTTHYTPTIAQFFLKDIRPQALFESLSFMKKGGKARFITPSSLAYGSSGYNTIPSYTSLIWDIELVDIFDGTFLEYEQKLIDQHISVATGYTFLDTVYYKNIWSGSGSVINKDSIVKVNYIGSYLDSFIFDTNIKSVAIDSNIYNSGSDYLPLEFKVGSTSKTNNVGQKSEPPLKGFQFAVRQMREGDTADFIIPSKYMYGASGSGKIPANTPLRFRIVVVDVRVKP